MHDPTIPLLASRLLGAAVRPEPAKLEDLVTEVHSCWPEATPRKFRWLARNLRVVAAALDEEAVLLAEALAEAECAG